MNTPEKNVPSQARKPYHSPVIHCYGSIRTITANVGKSGAFDVGGSGNKRKTAP